MLEQYYNAKQQLNTAKIAQNQGKPLTQRLSSGAVSGLNWTWREMRIWLHLHMFEEKRVAVSGSEL